MDVNPILRSSTAGAGGDGGRIDFTDNGPVDVAQLNDLYRIIGWDRHGRRTGEETEEMLRVSRFHVAAHAPAGRLVGFARVCGDPYIVQVLDVITHPDFRLHGVATECMIHVVEHLKKSRYVSVTLTDGTGIGGFYEAFGFEIIESSTPSRVWRRERAAIRSTRGDP